VRRFLSAQPWLAPIVGASAWERIASLAGAIPSGWCWAGVEVRLGEGDGRVDLAVGWLAGERGRLARAFASGARVAAPQELEEQVAGWEQRLAPVEGVCLEYDGCSASAPVVFWALDPGAIAGAPLEERLLEEMLVRDPGVRRTLLDTSAALESAGGRPLHVASLEPRGFPFARLVAMVSTEALAGVLERARWPGDFVSLEDGLLTRVAAVGRWVQVHLTCGRDGLRGDAAVELYAPSNRHAQPLWSEVLGDLEDAGLCTSGRRRQLLGWLYDAGAGADGRALDRRMYVKLSLAPGGGVSSAKAYLGVSSLGYFAAQRPGSPGALPRPWAGART